MFSKPFKILKSNLIFIQPLLIWQIIMTGMIYAAASRIQPMASKIVMYVSVLILLVLCLSGWFYINKHAVLSFKEEDAPEEKAEKSVQNFKKFFEGTGAGFVKTSLSCILLLVLYAAAFYGSVMFCINQFGMPEFINNLDKIPSLKTSDELMQFAADISDADKLLIVKWTGFLNIIMSVLNFFAVLYCTVITFEQRNFIICFFKSLKFFILHIFEAIGIMIFMFFLYLLISMLSAFSASNAFLFALLIIIITLYFNYYVLLLFCFYYDQTKDSSSNGGELVGQDAAGAETGSEV